MCIGAGIFDGFYLSYRKSDGCVHDDADTVNSFGFHPSLPLAATASGHRRFKSSADDEDDGSHLKGQASTGCPSAAVASVLLVLQFFIRAAWPPSNFLAVLYFSKICLAFDFRFCLSLPFAVEENCASVWRFACSWVCSQSGSHEDFPAFTEQDSEDQSSTPNEGLKATDLQPLQ